MGDSELLFKMTNLTFWPRRKLMQHRQKASQVTWAVD